MKRYRPLVSAGQSMRATAPAPIEAADSPQIVDWSNDGTASPVDVVLIVSLTRTVKLVNLSAKKKHKPGVPHRMTQFYLPPDRGDVPAIT